MDIVYREDQPRLEKLLRSVDRPGDFYAHGRSFYLMPRIAVDGVGVLSFPVPDTQVRALMAAAERAPYGRGPDTVVDTAVRDCWQIDAARVQVTGGAWPATFEQILDAARVGLGYPADRLDARLYKLLIYEPGGFFAPHRDTEKADGMVATLSIALPVAGAGGELVVRHRDREVVLDMQADEPSELAFAAFYADCAHETRPVRDGHRLSLVFNLCLRRGDRRTPVKPPDYGDRIAAIAEQLAGLREDAAGDKLVWLLDHEYTEAGLSFDALKNTDAAVARVLGQAAERADCALHAAIVHVHVQGDARFGEEYVDSWYLDDDTDADDMEMGEVFDSYHWIDGWVAPDGSNPPFGETPLQSGELLPRGALDDAAPDDQTVHEATGNEGVTLERTYRRAALVVWPRAKSLDVMVSAGIGRAVAWVAEECARDGTSGERIERLVSRLVDLWPTGSRHPDEAFGAAGFARHDGDWPVVETSTARESARADMLHLLAAVGDASLAARFVSRVIRAGYDGSENEDLLAVLDLIGPRDAAALLSDLVKDHFARLPEPILSLEREIGAREPEIAAWRDTQGAGLRSALLALSAALAKKKPADEAPPLRRAPKAQPFNAFVIRELFTLAWQCGMAHEAHEAARIIARHPRSVSPDRTLPAALRGLHREPGLPATAAYASLWRQAVDALLARSATPPENPRDWSIAADVACDCELCGKLRVFCRDPVVQQARFPLRKELRAHLHDTIERHSLDLDHETERRGRPYTLVCTKNRASHKRRRAEYVEDVSHMRSLMASAPRGDETERFPAERERLSRAVAAAERLE